MYRIVIRILKGVATTVVVVLVLAALGLFLLTSWKPGGYRPMRLSDRQQHTMASHFLEKVADEFRNSAQSKLPFAISFTQDQLNMYLASMDHIAALRHPVKHGEVYKLMDQAGLAEPALHLDDGVLMVMIRSREHEKVISTGLTFTFTEDAGLKIELDSAYVGRAPVPKELVRDRLQPVKAMLRKRMAKPKAASTRPTRRRGLVLVGFSTRDIDRIIRGAITAIDEEPIPAEDLISKVGAKVRVTAIDIDDGRITLHFVPVPSKKKPKG